MVKPPTIAVGWPSYTRLINSAFPPIDLFEDIADPADWELLARAEGRTNPRIAESIGQLDLVPVDRRVGGVGASYVMAPFVHCSPDRPGRFHDGHFGAFYAADSFATAAAEVAYHTARFLAATREAPGWIATLRELVGAPSAPLLDVRGAQFAALLDPDEYTVSQTFARAHRNSGADGILYPSVRNPGSECLSVFWPDAVGIPHQTRHFRYHWDGEQVDILRELTLTGDGKIFRLVD